MRKVSLLTIALINLLAISSFAQDTLHIGEIELADSIYGNLSMENIPSGRLVNRTFQKDPISRSVQLSSVSKDVVVSSDDMYQLLVEKKFMSFNPELVKQQYQFFTEVVSDLQEIMIDNESIVCLPIGIFDYDFQALDESSPDISQNNLVFSDNAPFAEQAYQTKRTTVAGPLFQFLENHPTHILFKEEWVDSEFPINFIEISKDGKIWTRVNLDTPVPFSFDHVAEQELLIRFYKGEKEFLHKIVVKSNPDFANNEKASFSCDTEISFENQYDQKLEACIMYGCDVNGSVLDKPFFLVTGFRPPIAGHSFKSIFKQYNTYMGGWIEELRQQGFDVVMVKFNYEQRPNFGVSESADLLEQLITYVNTIKPNKHYENVISATSMGADVARLAMLRMEKKHHEGLTDMHHHTRLLISIDAQFYGANLPLSIQYANLSYSLSPSPVILGGVALTLINYMTMGVSVKGARELMQYSCWHNVVIDETHPFITGGAEEIISGAPGHHYTRQLLLNEFQQFAPTEKMPMPKHCRHIAVSLGKYDIENFHFAEVSSNTTYPEPFRFRQSGLNYVEVASNNAEHPFIKAYTSNYSVVPTISMDRHDYKTLFGYVITLKRHRVYTTFMDEVDVTSGSYHEQIGNIAGLFAFAVLGESARIYSSVHKSTLSALAINDDLWPNNTHINLHDLNLMRDTRLFNSQDPQSDYYGYPNIGRPNDHFDITPFEAIYADNRADPHVSMKGRPFINEYLDFQRREVEPYWLRLQNITYGEQVRPEVPYLAKRRAKNWIQITRDESPMTDIGPVRLLANADVELSAGGFIIGAENDPNFNLNGELIFETEPGAVFEMKPNNAFDPCNNYKALVIEDEENTDGKSTVKDTGFNHSEKTVDINIYPNPNEGDFVIYSQSDQEKLIKVVNSVGAEVYKENCNKKIQRVSLNIRPGVYMLIITSDNNTVTRKIIIK